MENTLDGSRSLTAIFDSGDKAERAVAWLLNIGLRDSQIRQVALSGPETPAPAAAPAAKRRRGFMDSFVDFVMPEDKGAGRGRLGSGPRRVTVTDLPASRLDTVAQILNDEGKVEAGGADAGESVIANALQAVFDDASASGAQGIPGPAGTTLPQVDLSGATMIQGLLGACLVDGESGLMLGSEGGQRIDLDQVAVLDTAFMHMWRHTVDQLDMNDRIDEVDEIHMTLDSQIHLFRPLEKNRSLFIFVALDRALCNLGMARLQLKHIEASLPV